MLGRRVESQELAALGERIRERRMELRLSQEALAEKAGISANTVSRIEGGQMAMGIGTFINLVQAMDADADSLLGVISDSGKKRHGDIFHRISHLREPEREIVLWRHGDIFHRISHLREPEREIVLRTIEALMESLRRGR